MSNRAERCWRQFGGGQFEDRAALPHPWFGPLDAAGWHALAAGHMAIHRVQIERILQGLAKAPQ